MKSPKMVSETELSEELKQKINGKLDKTGTISWEQVTDKPQLADDSWKSPVATVQDLPLTGNSPEDIRLVLTTNEVYTWAGAEWVLIGANDVNVEWSHIQNKPADYQPAAHTHSQTEISDLTKDWQEIANKPVSYPPDVHTHTKANINDFAHTHTKTEVTDFTHTHTKAEVTDFSHTHPISEVTDLQISLNSKAALEHTHDGRYYTESEIETKLSGKSDSTHTHTDLHSHSNKTVLDKVTETISNTSYNLSQIPDHETRLQAIEGGYSEGHFHSNLAVLEKVAYTGAQSVVDLKGIETNTAAITGKADINHTHIKANITDFSHTHTKSEITDFAHNHDNLYYTETEIDTKLAAKADSTSLTGHTGNSTIHVTQTDKDNWNNKASTDTATTTTNGLISAIDKAKLDGIADNANNYAHPSIKQCSYTAPVSSVNTKTGAVVLTASDVGAASGNDLQTLKFRSYMEV